MKSRAFVAATLVIIGSWFIIQYTRNTSRYRIMKLRGEEISLTSKEIEAIEDSLMRGAADAISKQDLLRVAEASRLEGRLRDLHMKNAMDLMRNRERCFPEFIALILLVGISLQIATKEKKLKSEASSLD